MKTTAISLLVLIIGMIQAHAQGISRIEVKQTGQKKEGQYTYQVAVSVMQASPEEGTLELWYVYKPAAAISVGASEILSKKLPFNLRTPGSKTQDIMVYPYLDWVVFIRNAKQEILGYKASSAFAEAGAAKMAQKSGGLPGKGIGAKSAMQGSALDAR